MFQNTFQALNWDKQYKANATGCGHQETSNDGCSNICVPQGHPVETVSQNRVCLCPDYSAPSQYFNGTSENTCSCPTGQYFNKHTGYCHLSELCHLARQLFK